jgi:hypothetical protein
MVDAIKLLIFFKALVFEAFEGTGMGEKVSNPE